MRSNAGRVAYRPSSKARLARSLQAPDDAKHGRMEIMADTQITVTLPPELEAFIQESVASGRFATAGEAVREGLRLLEEREQERDAVLTELRQEIEIGVEQAKAGQLIDGRAFFEQLRQKIRSAS